MGSNSLSCKRWSLVQRDRSAQLVGVLQGAGLNSLGSFWPQKLLSPCGHISRSPPGSAHLFCCFDVPFLGSAKGCSLLRGACPRWVSGPGRAASPCSAPGPTVFRGAEQWRTWSSARWPPGPECASTEACEGAQKQRVCNPTV